MKSILTGLELELNPEEAFSKLTIGQAIYVEDLEVLAKTILLCYERGFPIGMKGTRHRQSWLGQGDTQVFEIKENPNA